MANKRLHRAPTAVASGSVLNSGTLDATAFTGNVDSSNRGMMVMAKVFNTSAPTNAAMQVGVVTFVDGAPPTISTGAFYSTYAVGTVGSITGTFTWAVSGNNIVVRWTNTSGGTLNVELEVGTILIMD